MFPPVCSSSLLQDLIQCIAWLISLHSHVKYHQATTRRVLTAQLLHKHRTHPDDVTNRLMAGSIIRHGFSHRDGCIMTTEAARMKSAAADHDVMIHSSTMTMLCIQATTSAVPAETKHLRTPPPHHDAALRHSVQCAIAFPLLVLLRCRLCLQLPQPLLP